MVSNNLVDKALIIYDNNLVISHIYLGNNCLNNAREIIENAKTREMPDEIITELSNLLNNKPHKLKYKLGKLTEFQKSVYDAMLKIPYGETISYSELAINIGHKGASRAVGSACNKNALPLIIPCHRVTAKTSLGGYAPGLEYKKKLLFHEKMNR